MKPDQQNNYWQADDEEIRTDVPELDTVDVRAETEALKNATIDDAPVNWTADEYVHGEKNGLWYVGFIIIVLGLIAVDVFLLQSWTFSVLVVVMAVSVIVYSRRPPRTIQYTLSVTQGLYVGEKLYNLADFKSFGLIRDGERHSIMLIPIKRFSPGLSVYFPEEAGERIVDILGSRLPIETLKLDAIDILVRRLRL